MTGGTSSNYRPDTQGLDAPRLVEAVRSHIDRLTLAIHGFRGCKPDLRYIVKLPCRPPGNPDIVLSDYLRGIDVLSIAISEPAHLPT
jgi:hypothetical protein